MQYSVKKKTKKKTSHFIIKFVGSWWAYLHHTLNVMMSSNNPTSEGFPEAYGCSRYKVFDSFMTLPATHRSAIYLDFSRGNLAPITPPFSFCLRCSDNGEKMEQTSVGLEKIKLTSLLTYTPTSPSLPPWPPQHPPTRQQHVHLIVGGLTGPSVTPGLPQLARVEMRSWFTGLTDWSPVTRMLCENVTHD